MPNQPTSSSSSVLLEGEVVRHAAVEVVVLVVDKVALDEKLVVELSVVAVLDGAELVDVELGAVLEEIEERLEEDEYVVVIGVDETDVCEVVLTDAGAESKK